MKTLKTFKDIDIELRRLNLERQIALEELKVLKGQCAHDLRPANWIQTGIRYAGRFGVMMLLKKIIR